MVGHSRIEKLNGTDDKSLPAKLASDLTAAIGTRRQRVMKKLALAAIGAIPWVGGFAAATIDAVNDGTVDDLQKQWLERHAEKLHQLEEALSAIAKRLEQFGAEVDDRIESPEFLSLVEKAFRVWDESSSQEKRDSVRRLLANAAASKLCGDDLVRLFLDWITRYDETHFNVMRAVYSNSGITRQGIWLQLHDTIPRDNSLEANLFKLLIHDLALGHVIRHERTTTSDGQFVKKRRAGIRRTSSPIMKTPFDDVEPYELTELGNTFVHYVMDEVAPQIGDASTGAPEFSET